MTDYDLLVVLGCGLAFLRYVTCFVWARWITLGGTVVLAGWLWSGTPPTAETALYWVGALVLVLAALWCARPFWTTRPASSTSAAKSNPNRIVVDGTNVMYWDGSPSLHSLRLAVDALVKRKLEPIVFLDASTRHHLNDKDLNAKGFARALGLKAHQITICPAGTEADEFLIKYARTEGLPIVSNDRFGDRAKQAKGVKRIRGVVANGKVVFEGF